MAKTTAPLLSFGARGTIAKVQTYSTWKGRAYARAYAVPSNPNTEDQQEVRSVFSFLQRIWKTAPAEVWAPYQAYARGKVLTDRNAFTKFNAAPLQFATDLDELTLSPGAMGGLPPTGMNIVPGAGELAITITAPGTLPAGWTVDRAVAAIIRDQDPHTGVLFDIQADDDTSDPYVITFTGLAAAVYQVRAWLIWNRPDGALAYSPDLKDQGTAT